MANDNTKIFQPKIELTDEQRAALERRAAQEMRSTTAHVRALILQDIDRPQPPQPNDS